MKILALILALNLTNSIMPRFWAKVESENAVSVTISRIDKQETKIYTLQEDFNAPKRTGQPLDIDVAYGTITIDDYYEFRSYDRDVWWCIGKDEIDFVPQENTPYALVFYQNGTTIENHECALELDCECYCYDDIFLGIYPL